MNKSLRGCTVLALLLLSFISLATPTTPPGFAVASAHPLATKAGLQILAAGGNAFDAAIAVSSVLAVVEPYHSGLGGGGMWLLYDAHKHKNTLIDAREVAPLAATKTMYQDSSGRVVPSLSLDGGLAAAIPGEPAALAYLAKNYGRLPLLQSLTPAIELAEKGFLVDSQFVFFSTMENRLPLLQKYPGTAKTYLRNGRPYRLNERLFQPELAQTLRVIGTKGHAGFYQGELAQKLVKGIRDAGGIWTLQDLANYQVILREPLQSTYHNMLVITAAPPSAGGYILITILNLLQNMPVTSFSQTQFVHFVVESMRLAYWQANTNIGDPGFVTNPLKKLLSVEFTDYLRSFIKPDKATASVQLAGNEAKKHQPSTTHFVILDKEGNRVAATLTVNYIFGCGVVAPGTGVLLNDEMDDFSSKVGVKNVFGVVGREANSIAPGKRPVSFMTPTFLEMPDRVALLGTPGGSRIPSMVVLAALKFYNSKGAISMVSAMRFHHQYLPDWLQFEPEFFSPKLQKQLQHMGYQLMPLHQYYGDMQSITWDKKAQIITAASDPRHIGLAVVVGDQAHYGVTH